MVTVFFVVKGSVPMTLMTSSLSLAYAKTTCTAAPINHTSTPVLAETRLTKACSWSDLSLAMASLGM